ncbi:hypothetical protein ACN27J_03255 [Solwaraspora sp. WMMB762]|uniref:hypothetical protein n=1 Tax=Solwaraspora sp. WMMB762 TaxID=3404120 RepID=UPI003B948ABB
MTTTRKSRRAVMADLLLFAAPVGIEDIGDGRLSVYFDTFAELREWLTAAGLDTPDLLTHHHNGRTADDGRRYQSLSAWPTWHGWEVFARAVEYPDLAALDVDTTDQLTALTEAT